MEREYTNRKYLDALKKKIVVFDGAMGTSLQKQNLTVEQFGEDFWMQRLPRDFIPVSRRKSPPFLP